MKIIFLDIDGVLNSRTSTICNEVMTELLSIQDYIDEGVPKDEAYLKFESDRLDKTQVNCLRYILKKMPDAKIVIHSTWKNYFSLEELKNILSKYGIEKSKILDVTKSKLTSNKCHDISSWLRSYHEQHLTIPKYVIFDDHNIDSSEWFPGKFIRVNSDNGLSYEHVVQALQILDSTYKIEEILI